MEIIIYDCNWQKKNPLVRYLGYFLVIVSLVVFSLTAGPVLTTEAVYRLERKNSVLSQETVVSQQNNQSQEREIAAEAEKHGVSTNFSIVIPKIQAKSEIIANVDSASEKDYQKALKYGVAHALGTGFPGENNTVYLFAHSSNPLIPADHENAVFYLVKELVPQDQIIVFFSGQKYIYEVTESFKTNAGDIRWLTQESSEEQLILQTCWPPGTRQKRLIVVAKPAIPNPKY